MPVAEELDEELTETAPATAAADAETDVDEQDETTGAALPTRSLITGRSYGHISRAILERPWAVQPAMLRLMADVLRVRIESGKPADAEIEAKLQAARGQNGDRYGGAKVGNVAIIPMYGVISQRMSLMADMSGGTSLAGLRSSLRAALDDPTIKAIVFDIDSPGGAVDGVTEFAAELRAVRGGPKPIVGSVNTLCASAALWAAANMTELVVTPSGEVGSIGVYAMHEDYSAADQMAGVKTTLISAGKYKVEGNAFEPLTDDARAAIQDQVNTFYGMFVADVAKGRKVSTDVVESDYGQGRTLLARKAAAAGLVDRIEPIDATIDRLQPQATPAGARAADGSQSPALVAAGTRTFQPDPAWNRRMKGRLR